MMNSSTAKFSDCRTYRYWLTRVWDPKLPMCAFIGLNPSTADESEDDPTIRKCIKYVKSWEHGGLLMLNLFAWRATMPADLWRARDKDFKDVIGLEGNRVEHLLTYLVEFKVTRTVAAWGAGRQQERARNVAAAMLRLDCLMRNDDGSPSHPLYLPDGLLPEGWNY